MEQTLAESGPSRVLRSSKRPAEPSESSSSSDESSEDNAGDAEIQNRREYFSSKSPSEMLDLLVNRKEIRRKQILEDRNRYGKESKTNVRRCNNCASCKKKDCMKCANCRDKYERKGLRKKACQKRGKCLNRKKVKKVKKVQKKSKK